MRLLFPGFLWAGLSVAVPILIHLLQLRRPQRVLFSNTAFVQEVELRTGRRRLQDLLVLALRLLGVLLLVLAFCQPFLPARVADGGVGEVAVLVDTSPSMQAKGTGYETVLQAAVYGAQAVKQQYGNGVSVRVVGQQRGGTPYDQALQQLLNKPNALGWGNSTLHPAWQQRGGALYILSDFQKSELGPEGARQLPTGREVVLLPQIARAGGNLYVDSIWLNDAFVRARAANQLHIRLRNGGTEPVENSPVKVLLGGHQVAAYQATVAAGEQAETVVQVQVQDAQAANGEILLDDAVRFDNVYYFTLRPTPAVQVVEIGPAPTTQKAYQNEALFRYSFAKTQQVDFAKLQQANLVVLSEPTEVSASLRDALLGVVRRGGSVAVVPTGATEARPAYTQLLQALGVRGVQWQPTNQVVKQELRMPNLQSPFFKDVFGAQPRQVALPEASPVLQVVSTGTDILRLRDGSGFLTEFAEGAGKVYVFSAPFDSNYSDFTTQSLFVPVLYRLAMLSYRTDQPLAYRVGAGSVQLLLPAPSLLGSREEAAYRLVHDSLTLVPAQRQLGSQLRLEIPAELTVPGIYQVTRNGQALATLAFNYPRRESELAAYSPAELRQLFSDKPNVRVLEPGSQLQALRQYRDEQTGRPLWRYCVLLALAALLAETLVLRWGRPAPVLGA